MKNLILGTLALLAISANVKSQDSFYEGIEKFEGKEFQERYAVTAIPEKEGYYRPGGDGRVVTFGINKTENGNYCGVTAYEVEGDKRGFVITDQITDYVSFSYNYPGVVAHKHTKKGYVFVENMLIQIEGVSQDGLSYKNIGRIYWLKLTNEEVAAAAAAKDEAKSKMSMKEKLAAAKNVVTNGIKGDVRYEKVVNTNLDELIKNHLKEMNGKHLSGDKGKEADIALDIENEKALFLKDRQKDSKAYAAKLEAQKAKYGDEASTYILKNNSGASVRIITGAGSTSELSAGASTTFTCGTDIYYCSGQNTQGPLVADGDESCGQTASID